MSVFGGDDLLAAISQLLLIPDNGFEEALQRARGNILIQSNGFGVFTLHIGKQSAHINQ